jgi:DNA-binding transcriptional regulator YbjK
MSSGDRREELVSAALRVIARDGVTGATTRAIVAEAGMPLASFHYAFDSRDALMRELIATVIDTETTAVFASFEVGRDIRSTIADALIAFLDTIAIDPGHEQAMFELMQYALRTPGLEGLARDQWDGYRAAVAEILTAGAAQASITWALPVADVARIVVTITDGLTLAWLADRDRAAAERVIAFAADSLARLAVPVVSGSTPSVRTKEHSA